MAANTLERTYTIPLRKISQKATRQKRTNRAVKAVRQFLEKHMKSENVKLGIELNELLWKDGSRNPPGKVTVNAIKDAEGNVIANLEGVKMAAPVVAKEEKAPLGAKEEAKAETTDAKAEEKADDVPAEAKEAEKAVEKTAPKADNKVHDNVEAKAEEADKKSKAADKVAQVATEKQQKN